MTPEEYRQGQNAISIPIVSAVLAVLKALPIGIRLTPEQWQRVIRLLFPVVVKGRQDTIELAKVFYLSQSPSNDVPQVADPFYDENALAKTFDLFASRGIELQDSHDDAAVMGAAAAGRHVEQAGREWIVNATSKDNVRFARYDPYGETCGFCRLLISRGPVYRSEVSGNFRSHPMCTCVAVPVFDTMNWPGRDQYLEAEQQYIDATRGKRGNVALKAFYTAVEGKTLPTVDSSPNAAA